MSFLRVDGLSKSFGGLKAVRDVDFVIEEGETIGLIGPNGSGKTTTLNLLTGFLKPNSGAIVFRGKDIAGLPRAKVCPHGIARTFQLIKPFLEFTALQNVMVGRMYGRDRAKSMKAAAEESRQILDRVGLLGKAEVLSKDLTLMERKRLELARALAAKPYLLLLDELMAGLNHAEAEDAMNLIRQIKGGSQSDDPDGGAYCQGDRRPLGSDRRTQYGGKDRRGCTTGNHPQSHSH